MYVVTLSSGLSWFLVSAASSEEAVEIVKKAEGTPKGGRWHAKVVPHGTIFSDPKPHPSQR